MASESNDQSFLRGDLNEEGWEYAGSSKIGSYKENLDMIYIHMIGYTELL